MKRITTSANPSNIRSTKRLPKAVPIALRSRLPRAYARTNSPIRAGSTLFAMRLMAVAPTQPANEGVVTGDSRMRHRTARIPTLTIGARTKHKPEQPPVGVGQRVGESAPLDATHGPGDGCPETPTPTHVLHLFTGTSRGEILPTSIDRHAPESRKR